MQRIRTELRVIGADDRNAEQARDAKAAETDRSGRRDVDNVGLMLLDAGEHIRRHRETQGKRLVAGDRSDPVGTHSHNTRTNGPAGDDDASRETAVSASCGELL